MPMPTFLTSQAESTTPTRRTAAMPPPIRTTSADKRLTFTAAPPTPMYSFPPLQKLIKVTIMQYRHPALTSEQFHRYWSTVHGPLMSHVLAKHGVHGYTQYHIPQPLANLDSEPVPPTPMCPTTAHPSPSTHFPSAEQTQFLGSLSSLARSISSARGWNIQTYDAMVEFTVKDTATLEKVFTDMEYLENVRPDEAVFLDKTRGSITVGWVEDYVRNGQVIKDQKWR